MIAYVNTVKCYNDMFVTNSEFGR